MEYFVEFSKRRTINVSVKDGRLFVKAPKGTPRLQIEDILKKHSRWISDRMEKSEKLLNLENNLTKERVEALKKTAKGYFAEKTAYYAALMGLKYNRITITSARTRFGSCSSKGNICFSYRLMLYPEKSREYVVVHELAHLVHMNHSSVFYDLVRRYMPDYKERRALLKDIPE